MSKGAKRNLDDARADAEYLRELLAGTAERWCVAGSVRRGLPEVGDVEHVVIPRIENGKNLLWAKLDELLPGEGLFGGQGEVAKAVYLDKNGKSTNRWGERYRGVLFRGFKHEIFTADTRNWGAILAIRTGPAELSQRLVTEMQRYGCRQDGGYVIRNGAVVEVATEEEFFRICGVKWMKPEARHG